MRRVIWGILLGACFGLASRAQTLRLTSPNGGESWEESTVKAITWTSSGITARVRLILFKDGARIGEIARSLDVAAGSFSWTVGNYEGGTAAAAEGYKVRIRTEDGAVVDNSDASFTITPASSPELRELPPTAVKKKEDAFAVPLTAMKKWEPVDLALTKIWSEHIPGLCGLRAEVKCLKGKFSGHVVFGVDYGTGSGGIKQIGHNLDLGLNETQTVSLQRVEPITVWAGNPCGRSCTVTVDSPNSIAETDESNNSLKAEVYFFSGNPRIVPPIRIGRAPDVMTEGQVVELDADDFSRDSGHIRPANITVSFRNCGCSQLNCRMEVWQKGRWPNAHELSPRDQEHLAGVFDLPLSPGPPAPAQITFLINIYCEPSTLELSWHCEGPQEGPDLSKFYFYLRI